MSWLIGITQKPFEFKLHVFKLENSKGLLDCKGFMITFIILLILILYGMSAYERLGMLTLLLQYKNPAVGSLAMFNSTFPGGIINYLFDNTNYDDRVANALVIFSQFDNNCDAFYKANEKIGNSKADTAFISF